MERGTFFTGIRILTAALWEQGTPARQVRQGPAEGSEPPIQDWERTLELDRLEMEPPEQAVMGQAQEECLPRERPELRDNDNEYGIITWGDDTLFPAGDQTQISFGKGE